MKHELDNMVTELCALDAELAKNPALVRRIVEELQRSAPEVAIDDAFRARLRGELLKVKSEALPAPKQALPWWLLYATPLGVTVLLLMLVRPSPVLTPQIAPEESADAPAAGTMMKTDMMMTDEMYESAPADDASLRTGVAGATDYFTAAITQNTVVVSYLTTSLPAYVVVTDAYGATVAVSELLPPGEHINYAFDAQTIFAPNLVYTATLYYDDGNGIFTEGLDAPAVDSFGTVIALPLVTP